MILQLGIFKCSTENFAFKIKRNVRMLDEGRTRPSDYNYRAYRDIIAENKILHLGTCSSYVKK